VAFWIYLGFKLSISVGLHKVSEDSAAEVLTIIYMSVWFVAVIALSIKAGLKAVDLVHDSEAKR